MARLTLYLWNDLRCPLSRNVRRDTVVAGRSLLPLSTVVVIAVVAAVARAWRFLCVCPKTPHATPASRRSRAAGKLALSPSANALTIIQRVRVNICHMAPPTLRHAACPTLTPRQLSSPRQKYIIFFYLLISIIIRYSNIACNSEHYNARFIVVCFLAAVLAILLVAHGRPRGVCCLVVSVVVNAILLLLLYHGASSPTATHLLRSLFVLDVRVYTRCDVRSIRNGNVFVITTTFSVLRVYFFS